MSQAQELLTAPVERTTFDAPMEGIVNDMAYHAGVFAGKALVERVVRDYDPLTNLLDRRGFAEAVNHTLESNPDKDFGLTVLDLGNYKWVNTEFTHEGGDYLLYMIARKLRRKGDEAVRLGGDEFAILFELDRGPDYASHEEQLAAQVDYLKSIRTPLIEAHPDLDKGPIRFYVGAGAIVYDRSMTLQDNLGQADLACEASKHHDRAIYGEMRSVV